MSNLLWVRVWPTRLHVNCFVSIHVLLQLSVFYHHREENEASYAVWLSCSKIFCLPCLSDWFASHHTLLTRMVCSSKSESAQRISIMDTAHPRGGWLATQSTPWISPWHTINFLHVNVTEYTHHRNGTATCFHTSPSYCCDYLCTCCVHWYSHSIYS